MIKYKIHFGEKAFSVNEWLYNYFNEVKEKPHLYNQLFDIIVGVKKQLLTAILILTVSFASAQKQVYSISSTDSIVRVLRGEIAVLQNQIVQQQTSITNLTANQARPTWMDPLYFIITKSAVMDSVTLKTPIIVR